MENFNPKAYGLQPTEYNLALIVRWIKDRNWTIDAHNLRLAIGHQTLVGHLQWDKAKSQRTESRHKDDGKPFLMDDTMKRLSDGSWTSKTAADYARERREKETRQAAPHQTELSESDATWRQMAQSACRYGTHAQQFQLQKIYDNAVARGLSWRQVFEAVDKDRKQYEKAAMIAFVNR